MARLIDTDLGLRPRTVAAFRAAVADGVQITVATGRMAKSARPFAEALGQTAPIIAYQGALIREMWEPGAPLGKLLFHRPLPAAVARETLTWSAEHGLAAHVNHLERFVLPASDPRADDYSAFLGARAEIVPDLSGLGPAAGDQDPGRRAGALADPAPAGRPGAFCRVGPR